MRDQRDQPDRPGQQTQSASADHRDPVVRGANSIDRYSLALQLIQVFPIILAGVAFVFPYEWLRIVIAALGLAFWTTWAIVRERNSESTTGPTEARNEAFLLHTAIPLQTAVERALIPTTTATTEESVHGIRVEIWLHPCSITREPVGRRPRHRHTLPARPHRVLPPKPHPHQHSHTDEPEPEDRPGTPPASASRPGAGLRRALCSVTGRIHGQRSPDRFGELVHEDGPERS